MQLYATKAHLLKQPLEQTKLAAAVADVPLLTNASPTFAVRENVNTVNLSDSLLPAFLFQKLSVFNHEVLEHVHLLFLATGSMPQRVTANHFSTRDVVATTIILLVTQPA